MTAGLPKLSRFVLLSLLLAFGSASIVAAQTVQTPSDGIDPIFDVQTPSVSLEPLYAAIAASPIATQEQIEALGAEEGRPSAVPFLPSGPADRRASFAQTELPI
jgi:hypothetical protein